MQECLRAERLANEQGKYVFYRSEPGQFRGYEYFIEELYRLFNLFNKRVSFVWNRFFADAARQKTINEYVDMLKQDINVATAVKKGAAFNQLLSANLALFGNVFLPTSCTWDYFLHNSSIEQIDIKSLFERIFNIYDFDKKYIQELVSIDYSWMSDAASLQQIMIPRAIVDDVVMLATVGYCFPWPTKVDPDCWRDDAVNVAIVAKKLQLTSGRHICISSILDKYMHGNLDANDAFQVRILMNAVYGLNPESGIEIHQYTQLAEKSVQHFKKQITHIAGQVFRAWLEKELKSKQVPRHVQDTKLGQTLKKIGKGRPSPIQAQEVQEQEEQEIKVSAMTPGKQYTPASIWKLYATKEALDRNAIATLFINDCARDAIQNDFIPPKTPGIVRIMTYNVHFWTDSLKQPNYQAILNVIKKLNADILVLQEVHSFNEKDWTNDLRGMGYEYLATSPIHRMKNDSLNNMILSKLRLSRSRRQSWAVKVYTSNTKGETRNFIGASIQLPNKKTIDIYGTHLDIQDSSGTIREKQVKELLAAAQKDPNDNVLLLGDWNAVRKDDYQYRVAGKLVWDLYVENFVDREFYTSGLQDFPPSALSALELIQANGFQDCFTKAHLPKPKYTVWSGTVVDFIFCGPTWNLPIAGCYVYYSAASDHLPVIMDIKVK